MRAKAGDPPRTMAQKILAGRADPQPQARGDLVEVKVDQIVMARSAPRAFAEATAIGLKKPTAEVAIAYDGACITGAESARAASPFGIGEPLPAAEMAAHGIFVARPGVGFPSVVHLERFASPARLCVTDDPRLASVGGIGMLSLVVPPSLLGQALSRGSVWLRPPRSVQVLLSGRVRPFVCARDVSLELVRRGLGEAVRKVEEEHRAPVVLEFAGPSARLLSVAERAVLAGIAPQLGAAAALFVSDERTEVFLRDQRRSKAHRALAPDAGAPCDDVIALDLGAVDPLLLDDQGQVRGVRDLAGKPVSQVLLGGDSGTTLRDLFAAAALLKSKRVPARLDLLLAVPSRQMLEVLASAGALTDLIATGARLVEPDARVMTGDLYPVAKDTIGLRTADPEPRTAGRPSPVVASAETLAYAVATGEVGDPRAFKRPVRVTVPRALPTDDVLIVRERRAADVGSKKGAAPPAVAPAAPWKGPLALDLIDGASFVSTSPETRSGKVVAVLCAGLDEVRDVAAYVGAAGDGVRAVIAPFIPSGTVSLLSAAGVIALQLDAGAAKALKGQAAITLPAPSAWAEKGPTSIGAGTHKVPVVWLAVDRERAWTSAGTPRPPEARPARAAK